MSKGMKENEPEIVEVKSLRKCLQRFSEDVGTYINDDQRYKLGRVLTIIDAAISDTEQRKAIKDLVNNEWWSHNDNRVIKADAMTSPHTDMRGLCKALGFELYEKQDYAVPMSDEHYTEWSTQSYKKTIKE